jgi:hypothetical protein
MLSARRFTVRFLFVGHKEQQESCRGVGRARSVDAPYFLLLEDETALDHNAVGF